MFSISEISQKISGNITRELDLDEDKKAVINYGIFALIQIMLSIVSVIVFGAIFNVVVEALIISFVTSILRKIIIKIKDNRFNFTNYCQTLERI